jgi:copper chaperone NosL
MTKTSILLLAFLLPLLAFNPSTANGEPIDTVSAEIRCSVCGMFVAKYPNWLAQIHYDDPSQTRFFDGPKDMMVFYFAPEQYGGPSRETIKDIFVKDYYTLNWMPAKDAFYVIGSDVYGPMGHEFIPFATKDAADSFLKDHHGKEVLTFDKITPELVESLREGQRMR